MTAEQCMKRLSGITSSDDLGTAYTWVRQGMMSSKVFRQVIQEIVEHRVEVRLRELEQEKKVEVA